MEGNVNEKKTSHCAPPSACNQIQGESNSDRFDDCSRLLQMKSEKIIHIPTTSSKMKKIPMHEFIAARNKEF